MAQTTFKQQQFSLAALLCIATDGIYFGDLDGIYALTKFMTGESVFTHELSTVGRAIRPELIRQLPFLADIHAEKTSEDKARILLGNLEAKHGKYHTITVVDTQGGQS